MPSEQRYPTAPIAVLLVLLLYLLAAFVSASMTSLGLPKLWAEFGMRGLLAGAGLILYITYGRRDGPAAAMSPRNALLLGMGLTTLLIAYEVLALIAQTNDGSYSELPPFDVVAVQQALGAAGEEILFVGFLYGVLRRQHSWATAVLCAGFLFVLLHWPTSVLGVVTRALYIICSCALFERVRAVALNISMHLAVNGVVFVCALMFTSSPPPDGARDLAGPAAVVVGSAALLFALWAGFLLPRVRARTSGIDAPSTS